jgi:hypothetical protein
MAGPAVSGTSPVFLSRKGDCCCMEYGVHDDERVLQRGDIYDAD